MAISTHKDIEESLWPCCYVVWWEVIIDDHKKVFTVLIIGTDHVDGFTDRDAES